MLSNSYTETVKKLFDGFEVKTVKAKPAINSKADGRGDIREAVGVSYPINSDYGADRGMDHRAALLQSGINCENLSIIDSICKT